MRAEVLGPTLEVVKREGWCKTPHDVFLEWPRVFGAAADLLQAILNRTVGAGREEARISNATFQHWTGKSESAVRRQLQHLQTLAVILPGMVAPQRLLRVRPLSRFGRTIEPRYSLYMAAIEHYCRVPGTRRQLCRDCSAELKSGTVCDHCSPTRKQRFGRKKGTAGDTFSSPERVSPAPPQPKTELLPKELAASQPTAEPEYEPDECGAASCTETVGPIPSRCAPRPNSTRARWKDPSIAVTDDEVNHLAAFLTVAPSTARDAIRAARCHDMQASVEQIELAISTRLGEGTALRPGGIIHVLNEEYPVWLAKGEARLAKLRSPVGHSDVDPDLVAKAEAELAAREQRQAELLAHPEACERCAGTGVLDYAGKPRWCGCPKGEEGRVTRKAPVFAVKRRRQVCTQAEPPQFAPPASVMPRPVAATADGDRPETRAETVAYHAPAIASFKERARAKSEFERNRESGRGADAGVSGFVSAGSIVHKLAEAAGLMPRRPPTREGGV
jgi:hypothetical protein